MAKGPNTSARNCALLLSNHWRKFTAPWCRRRHAFSLLWDSCAQRTSSRSVARKPSVAVVKALLIGFWARSIRLILSAAALRRGAISRLRFSNSAADSCVLRSSVASRICSWCLHSLSRSCCSVGEQAGDGHSQDHAQLVHLQRQHKPFFLQLWISPEWLSNVRRQLSSTASHFLVLSRHRRRFFSDVAFSFLRRSSMLCNVFFLRAKGLAALLASANRFLASRSSVSRSSTFSCSSF